MNGNAMWAKYRITLGIKNRIVGGVPTDPELIKGWISANMPSVSEAEKAKLAEATAESLPAATEDAAEGMWTTFKRHEGAVCIEGRAVKAMFKEAANIMREALIKDEARGKDGDEKKTSKSRFTALRSKLAERLFVEENFIPLMRHGEAVKKPDAFEERAIHVMTAQGPRSALKRCDYVEAPATVTFSVRHLRDGVVDIDLIKTLLEFASYNGLGADRSQGNGLFDVVEIQPIG